MCILAIRMVYFLADRIVMRCYYFCQEMRDKNEMLIICVSLRLALPRVCASLCSSRYYATAELITSRVNFEPCACHLGRLLIVQLKGLKSVQGSVNKFGDLSTRNCLAAMGLIAEVFSLVTFVSKLVSKICQRNPHSAKTD